MANAWHDIISPGGYEWWSFDAEDKTRQVQVVVTFFQGCPFSRGYRKAYERYRNRPTRHVPPRPADWPYVGALVLRGKNVLARRLQPFAAGQFSASQQNLSVAIGGNTVQRLSSGHYRVHVDLPGCKVRMTLVPVFQPPVEERAFVDHARVCHRWIVAAPLCRAEATIGAAGESISFDGLACHDHHYGTAPLHEAARRIFFCRMLFDDRAVLLHIAQSADRSRADDVTVLEASRDDLVERQITDAAIGWSGLGLLRPRRPHFIRAGEISLCHPTTLFAGRFRSRLTYEFAAGAVRGIAAAQMVEF